MFDEESIRRAISQAGMFQLLDTVESLKLDVYPRELVPGELNRSVLAESWHAGSSSSRCWTSYSKSRTRFDRGQIPNST